MIRFLSRAPRPVAWENVGVVVAVIAAALALLVLAFHAPVRAQEAEFESYLVLVVDVSGSVTTAEYAVQRDGYVEVLLDPMIAQALDRTAVTIVEFATKAVVTVEWTDVRGAGAAYRESSRPFAGNTCVYCGLELALQLLDGKSGKRVIDISGDGVENVKTPSDVFVLRDLATTEEIEVNTLALLVEADQTYGGYFQTKPANNRTLETWYAEMANGFAMAIASLDDIAKALRRKLFSEVAALEPQHPLMRE